MASKRFRQNVAIVVVNKHGEVLACERSDIAGAWQIPQGGVDLGEDLLEAMKRELKEEIGTSEIDTLGQLETPIKYNWPEHLHRDGYCGQEQYYFLVRLRENAKIKLDAHPPQEFAAYAWLSAADLLSRISGFKAEAYRQGIEQLQKRFPNVIL